MGLVYSYLVAWIAGGVLLGTTMLMNEPRDGSPDTTSKQQAEAEARGPDKRISRPSTSRPLLHLLALSLLGFGLSGLAAEGLGVVASPWTAGVALVGASLLGAAGYVVLQLKRNTAPLNDRTEA
jgi:hypothetical protein